MAKAPEVLIQITAPHFVAGVVAADGRVTEAAPIVGYMVGWSGARFAAYCANRSWAWQRVAVPAATKKSPGGP